MDDYPTQVSAYGSILLMGIIGALLVCFTILIARVIAPKKPNPIKLSTYECGEETAGSAWIQFNPRFYIIALIFLLFDVELIFVFPWSIVFGNEVLIATDSRWGWFTLVEMSLFLMVLIIGLLYVWRRGDLDWIKAENGLPKVDNNIPAVAYDNLNRQVYVIRDYKIANPIIESEVDKSHTTVVVKPAISFKPRFKKSEE